jgi:thioesterase domain-containing protein
LQSRALTDVTQEYSSINDMAADYAAAIRVQQPTGPYYLLGWSMGGVLAMSVARVLEHQGQGVAFVGLLDVYLPTPDNLPWDQDPLRGIVLAFGGTMANALAMLDAVAQHTLRRELWGLPPLARLQRLISWGRERHLLPASLPLEVLQQQVALTEAHLAMLKTHRIATIQAPLYIWWARHGLQEAHTRPDWGAYTLGSVRIGDAEGNHFSMMQAPHVQGLTAQLQASLQAVQGMMTPAPDSRRASA